MLRLKIDVTASSNELLRDALLPSTGRTVEWLAPILHLKVDVTSSCNELFRDGLMPISGRGVERRQTIRPILEVDVDQS